MLRSVTQLLDLAKNAARKRIVVCNAHDDLVIHAIAEAIHLGIIHAILIGNAEQINAFCITEGIEKQVSIHHATSDEDAVLQTMKFVNTGQADLIMKGLIDTKVLLKGVVNSQTGIKSRPLLSHVGLLSYPTLDRVLYITDGAMNIQPSVDEKCQIIENAVYLTKKLGYVLPKVGLVSAVEKVNPKIASTVDAQAIIEHYHQYPGDFLIDGPFAIDNLVSLESVKHKGISSNVAGVADILLFPNLDAGNVFYKTSVFLASASAAGMVIGAKVPIVLTSRADEASTKLHSIALGVMLCD